MFSVILLIMVAEAINAAGQIFYKKSMNSIQVKSLRGVKGYLAFFRKVAVNPMILLGMALMSVCLVLWLIALAQADLSFVFPVGSVQYVFIMFAAHFFLGEKIDRLKLAGTFMVVAGVILISLN